MGQSQSYDLRNPDFPDVPSDPVRGVRRISKEHETRTNFFDDENCQDYREDELREKIRKDILLKKREEELETLRIQRKEKKEPIIDAFRNVSPSPTYIEFSYYDSIKYDSPNDKELIIELNRHREINNGVLLEFKPIFNQIKKNEIIIKEEEEEEEEERKSQKNGNPKKTEIYTGKLSQLNRVKEIEEIKPISIQIINKYSNISDNLSTPIISSSNYKRRKSIENNNYPKYYKHNGNISRLKRHQEIERCPIFKNEEEDQHFTEYPKSNKFNEKFIQLPIHPKIEHFHESEENNNFEKNEEKTITEIQGEKRMVVGIGKISNYQSFDEEELHRQLEIVEMNEKSGNSKPFFIRPNKTEYDDKTCNVEYCTHVQIPDIDEEIKENKESFKITENFTKNDYYFQEKYPKTVGDEKELVGVVHLVKDGEIGSLPTETKKSIEEKLHYNPYLPTLSLERRPIVAFYDKLP